MSRGLGATERVVLRTVQALADLSEPATRHHVAICVFDEHATQDQITFRTPSTRTQMSSFHRAVRSLQRKDLLRETQWTNVLELTPSGHEALRGLPSDPGHVNLDLQSVRHRAKAGSPGSAPPG